MCGTTTAEQQSEVVSIIIDQFLSDCEPILDDEIKNSVICGRGDNAPVPECPLNAHWNNCAKRCEINFCGKLPLDCTDDEITQPLCICDEGYVMSDGNCITEEECTVELNQPGQWGNWLEWSDCNAQAPDCTGTKNRIRLCLAPTCGDGESVEEIECACAVIEGNFFIFSYYFNLTPRLSELEISNEANSIVKNL